METNTGTVMDGLRGTSPFAAALGYTIHLFGASFAPALVLGHLLGLILSPIGLFALLFYFVVTWMLPIR